MCDFQEEYSKHSQAEIYVEYCKFLQSLPDLIASEKEKIIEMVRVELKIEEIEISENLSIISCFSFFVYPTIQPWH